ncbi:MAG: hypothetical protein KJZ65_00275 [Phycisphaerales bacterium]|nr:hypothetical protein [Phycisphaerales bacterium]
MWHPAELTDAAARRIAEADQTLRREQAVQGLDALDEVALHPLLAEAFKQAGLGVREEQPYPGTYARRPLPRDRERCDLVLLPPGSTSLLDPLALLQMHAARQATLFASVRQPVPAGASPEDAFWLEVKSVAQVCYVEGVPVPNTSYARQLVRGPALDLAKLAREPMINAGGSLVLLFGASEDVVRHDLGMMTRAMIDRDLPISSPSVEVTPIADRAGNACVGLCLVPLRAVRER